MSHKIEYKKGDVISGFTFLEDRPPRINPGGQEARRALFVCKWCGKNFESNVASIRHGCVRSCGCSRRYKLPKALYNNWVNMRQRCLNEKHIKYHRYGGRGIKICDIWLSSYWAYEAYMLSLPDAQKKGYTPDRIDNDGNYEPGNMRWADPHTQSINTRTRKPGVSRYTGVYPRKKGWCAAICVDNRLMRIGFFGSIKEAVNARNKYIIDNDLEKRGYKTQHYEKRNSSKGKI